MTPAKRVRICCRRWRRQVIHTPDFACRLRGHRPSPERVRPWLFSGTRSFKGSCRITSDAPGPHVVMFCGIHGDEVSGIHAIEKVLFDFFGGTSALLRGSLTLARANEQAIAAERRYVKHNMNRMFREDYGPEIDRNSYEFRRTQELKSVLEGCDYFLDFHSAPIADVPFLVAEQKAVEFYRKLGIPRIMTGWSKFSSRRHRRRHRELCQRPGRDVSDAGVGKPLRQSVERCRLSRPRFHSCRSWE